MTIGYNILSFQVLCSADNLKKVLLGICILNKGQVLNDLMLFRIRKTLVLPSFTTDFRYLLRMFQNHLLIKCQIMNFAQFSNKSTIVWIRRPASATKICDFLWVSLGLAQCFLIYKIQDWTSFRVPSLSQFHLNQQSLDIRYIWYFLL